MSKKNEFNLFELARKSWKPTSLVALVLFILFLILKIILSLNVFSTLSKGDTFRFLNTISIGLLVLALAALVLGVLAYFVNPPNGKLPRQAQLALEGNVFFEDNNPVIGAKVTIIGVKVEETTGGNGYFKIEVPQQDSWEIMATYEGRVIQDSVAKENANEKIVLRFKSVLPTHRLVISGNVYFPDRQPVQGASVDILGMRDEEISNRQGWFSIRVNQQERWTVRAQFEGKTVLKQITKQDILTPLELELPFAEANEAQSALYARFTIAWPIWAGGYPQQSDMFYLLNTHETRLRRRLDSSLKSAFGAGFGLENLTYQANGYIRIEGLSPSKPQENSMELDISFFVPRQYPIDRLRGEMLGKLAEEIKDFCDNYVRESWQGANIFDVTAVDVS